MKLALLLVLGLVPAVLGTLERLGLPRVELEHQVWTSRNDASTAVIDHGAWDRFLAAYAAEDEAGVVRVAYGAVTPEDRAALADYIAGLAAVDLPAYAGPEQLAYWINLYNALTVMTVIEAYPVESIREIGGGLLGSGPWGEERVRVMGRPLSLDDIEHRIIRPVWREPRIHYAVNCAAVGCPDLGLSAYTGAGLDAELDAAERAYVNDPRGVRIEARELVLSKIWFWFQEDFGPSEGAVMERIRPLAEGRAAEALAGRTAPARYDYDWALNDAK